MTSKTSSKRSAAEEPGPSKSYQRRKLKKSVTRGPMDDFSLVDDVEEIPEEPEEPEEPLQEIIEWNRDRTKATVYANNVLNNLDSEPVNNLAWEYGKVIASNAEIEKMKSWEISEIPFRALNHHLAGYRATHFLSNAFLKAQKMINQLDESLKKEGEENSTLKKELKSADSAAKLATAREKSKDEEILKLKEEVDQLKTSYGTSSSNAEAEIAKLKAELEEANRQKEQLAEKDKKSEAEILALKEQMNNPAQLRLLYTKFPLYSKEMHHFGKQGFEFARENISAFIENDPHQTQLFNFVSALDYETLLQQSIDNEQDS